MSACIKFLPGGVVYLMLLLLLVGVVVVVGGDPMEDEDELDDGHQGGLRHRRLTSDSDRPSMHTYYEQSDIYDPTDDTLDLLENWRKNWFDMGWNPIILTPQQAQKLPQYEELMSFLPLDELTPDSIRAYKRWIAMASIGGGWLCDYKVFPLNHFLHHGRKLPYDGALTVYMGTNPVLVSGSADEYLRLAYQIGPTASKMIEHQKWMNENYPESYKKNFIWTDAAALQELRKSVSKDMFKLRGDVIEKNRIVIDGDESNIDCEGATGKRAIYYRVLVTTPEESKGIQASRFVNQWRAACEIGMATELPASATKKG